MANHFSLWANPERIDPGNKFDSPVPSLRQANKLDGIFNAWLFYGDADNYKEPEQRLMVAVLKDAISCAYGKQLIGKGVRRDHDEAIRWIWNLDSDATFSFNCVCETLGLEPEYVRREIRKMEKV